MNKSNKNICFNRWGYFLQNKYYTICINWRIN